MTLIIMCFDTKLGKSCVYENKSFGNTYDHVFFTNSDCSSIFNLIASACITLSLFQMLPATNTSFS